MKHAFISSSSNATFLKIQTVLVNPLLHCSSEHISPFELQHTVNHEQDLNYSVINPITKFRKLQPLLQLQLQLRLRPTNNI